MDRILAEALQLDEQARHAACGHYADESMDPDMDGWYEARTMVCHACAAADQHRRDHTGEPEPGELIYTVNVLADEDGED